MMYTYKWTCNMATWFACVVRVRGMRLLHTARAQKWPGLGTKQNRHVDAYR